MSRTSVSKMIQEMPEAIIFSDADGRIRFWNAGASRIFGFSESEALGQSLDIIIPQNLRHRHWAAFEEAMRTGKTRYGAGDVLAVQAMRKGGEQNLDRVQHGAVPCFSRCNDGYWGGSAWRHCLIRRDEKPARKAPIGWHLILN